MLDKLIEIANNDYDGHFTLMKFTTNWRCCLGTLTNQSRGSINKMAVGQSMDEAILNCIENNINSYDILE